MNDQKIPTRMTGPATKETINKRLVKVYHTDAGPLTSRQIMDLTGLSMHRLWERYTNFGWEVENIFSLEHFSRMTCKNNAELPKELAGIDISKLGTAQRTAKLRTMKSG